MTYAGLADPFRAFGGQGRLKEVKVPLTGTSRSYWVQQNTNCKVFWFLVRTMITR